MYQSIVSHNEIKGDDITPATKEKLYEPHLHEKSARQDHIFSPAHIHRVRGHEIYIHSSSTSPGDAQHCPIGKGTLPFAECVCVLCVVCGVLWVALCGL